MSEVNLKSLKNEELLYALESTLLRKNAAISDTDLNAYEIIMEKLNEIRKEILRRMEDVE